MVPPQILSAIFLRVDQISNKLQQPFRNKRQVYQVYKMSALRPTFLIMSISSTLPICLFFLEYPNMHWKVSQITNYSFISWFLFFILVYLVKKVKVLMVKYHWIKKWSQKFIDWLNVLTYWICQGFDLTFWIALMKTFDSGLFFKSLGVEERKQQIFANTRMCSPKLQKIQTRET